MKTIIAVLLITLSVYINAISFSDGQNFYVPRRDVVVRYGATNLASPTRLTTPTANAVGNTFDGVIDRLNTFLFLFSNSGTTTYITKIALSSFTVAQTVTYPRRPVQDSVMADNSFVYWLDNVPGNENTTWVRVSKDDITATPQVLSLIGSVVAVGPRPDPRNGSDPAVDLVAYFRGPQGLLQRTSTRTFTVIPAIPIPNDQVIAHVQNGFAYDLLTAGNDKIVRSYTFLTNALNATGSNTTITNVAADNVGVLQEDRYNRGFLHTVLFQNNADRRYIRHIDGTVTRSNQNPYTLTSSASADQLPRVDNNYLHYTSGGNLYVYDVRDGTNRVASLPSSASVISGLMLSVIVVASYLLMNM